MINLVMEGKPPGLGSPEQFGQSVEQAPVSSGVESAPAPLLPNPNDTLESVSKPPMAEPAAPVLAAETVQPSINSEGLSSETVRDLDLVSLESRLETQFSQIDSGQ